MILLVSSHTSQNQAIMRACAQRGRQDVQVINLADFPMSMDLMMAFSSGKQGHMCLRFAQTQTIDLQDVTAIWWHHPAAFGFPAALADPVHREFAIREATTAFRGLWQISQALWMNPIAREEAASHKPWQLHLAQQLGLTIPDTLITNSPEDARHFWRQYPGEVVYKAFHASHAAWRETRLLQPQEEALAEHIRLTPVIFQRYVPALYDLRILIVGEQMFAAAAAIQHGEYPIDVRMNRNMRYDPHTVPSTVRQQLFALMHHLHLEYGAIDMRLTPNGDYVFLEINPNGEYLYVEQATDLPISAAIAEHLCQGKASSNLTA